MRICLLSSRFPPQRCGVGDYTYFLAGALAEIGHDVHVITASGDMDDSLYPPNADVQVHRVIGSWGTTGLREVIRRLRDLDPGTLLIQYSPHAFDRRGITLAVNLLPSLFRLVGGLRVVTNFHEMYIPFSTSLKRDVGAVWQRAMALLLAGSSQAVSVTATEWARRLGRLGLGKRVRMIPVGSNIPKAPIGEQERIRVRQRVLGGSEGLLVAAFGAKHDRDVPSALYGLRELKRIQPAKLLWIGGGTPVDRHRRKIRDAMESSGIVDGDVQWTGQLSHPEVSKLLSACDLMLLPYTDGISTRRTSAVTALQHGLPLLTTTGQRPEPWFVHAENAYLVPQGDRKALMNGLLELAQNPELRTRIARGGRALYDTHFSWEVIAKQVASVA